MSVTVFAVSLGINFMVSKSEHLCGDAGPVLWHSPQFLEEGGEKEPETVVQARRFDNLYD